MDVETGGAKLNKQMIKFNYEKALFLEERCLVNRELHPDINDLKGCAGIEEICWRMKKLELS